MDWITDDIAAWFWSKGFYVVPVEQRLYIGDTRSWVSPKAEFWTDRITLLTAAKKLVEEVREKVSQDKAYVASQN